MKMSDDCSLFPYSLGCEHLAPVHTAEFDRLNRAIASADRGFRLLIAQYNRPYYRDQLVERLSALHVQSRILHVDLENLSDFAALQSRFGELAGKSDVLHVLGLEGWACDPAKEWLPSLNYQREYLAGQCPIPMVFWLPQRLIRLLALQAPDMWAWRAGVFDFSVHAKVETHQYFKPDKTFLTATERERRQQRILELEAYLGSRPDMAAALRASLLYEQGELYEASGETTKAFERYDHALNLYRSLNDERNIADTLSQIAYVLYSQGEWDKALRMWRDEVLQKYERLGDVRSRAVTMGRIADICEARGDWEEAWRIRREEELPVYERGDERSYAVTMGKIADMHQARGNLDEALQIRRQEELPVYERLGDVRERAVTMAKIADIYRTKGELDEALLTLKEEVLVTFDRFGDERSRAVTLGKIADVYDARGELDKALRIRREEELPVYERLGDLRSMIVARSRIAMAYLKLDPGRKEEANRLLCLALSDARRMNIPEAEIIRNILGKNQMTCDDNGALKLA